MLCNMHWPAKANPCQLSWDKYGDRRVEQTRFGVKMGKR